MRCSMQGLSRVPAFAGAGLPVRTRAPVADRDDTAQEPNGKMVTIGVVSRMVSNEVDPYRERP